MTSRNEAAERLLGLIRLKLGWGAADPRYVGIEPAVDEALAAERRATVERIRAAALAKRKAWGAEGLPASLESILDEVAK